MDEAVSAAQVDERAEIGQAGNPAGADLADPQLVEGVITRLAPFGAFCLVNGEIEGLIHISELSDMRINQPQEVVREGEKHVLRIVRIEAQKRRMGLSLKRVADSSYADLDWRAELTGERPQPQVEEDDEEEEELFEEEDLDEEEANEDLDEELDDKNDDLDDKDEDDGEEEV